MVNPINIPNFGRDNLPIFFVKKGYKVGAEIGVYKGEFTEKFCKAGLKMYAIDPWEDINRQDRQNFLFEHTKRTLSQYPDCKIIRKTSMDALEDFKDESLDFVYIDGNHEFKYIEEDIIQWEKKVRHGGTISGHDYMCTDPSSKNKLEDVGKAVNKFIETKNIKDFYIFGRTKPLEKESKNDKYLSWMFSKP